MTIPRNFDQMWRLSMHEMARRNIRDAKVKKAERRLFQIGTASKEYHPKNTVCVRDR